MMETNELIADRKNTHGDWNNQAWVANRIKIALRNGGAWNTMSPGQQEAVEMVAVKLSRIVAGNPAHDDHWDDLMGYALLGKQGHDFNPKALAPDAPMTRAPTPPGGPYPTPQRQEEIFAQKQD